MSDKELLSVHLAEMKFVNDQMHTRMRIVASYVGLAAGFFMAAFFTFFIEQSFLFATSDLRSGLMTVSPAAFWLLACLIAREQLLMVSHDDYLLNTLRPAILSCVPNKGDDEDSRSKSKRTLSFLRVMSVNKVSWVLGAFSAFAYLYPIAGSVILFVLSLQHYQTNDHALYLPVHSVVSVVIILILLLIIKSNKDSVDRKVDW